MALERVRILRWLEGNYSFMKMFSLHTASLCERQKTCWHPFKIRKLNGVLTIFILSRYCLVGRPKG